MCIKSKDNYCCDRKSLLIIEIDHIVVDEPHLMLRVTDILTILHQSALTGTRKIILIGNEEIHGKWI